ncbi:MAG: PPC domain-containing protein, partial [Gammaproteobacteria bacterium]|nr:PPC domain-containing protein [Gammaproteobacteria bacterium]
ALRPPTVTTSDRSFAPGTVLTASALFSVSNPDAVTIHQYMFSDSGGGAGSGHFEYRGVTRGAGIVIPMSTGELADLVYVAGATGTVDNLAVWTFSQLADFPYAWVSSGAGQFSVTAGSLPPDGAGDSPESATTLTVGSAPQTYRDCLGDTDTEDYYRFTLDGPANVIMGLTELSGNADLQFLDTDAAVQAVSSYPGNRSEMISIDADAGVYYARVVSIGGADTQYALTLAAV